MKPTTSTTPPRTLADMTPEEFDAELERVTAEVQAGIDRFAARIIVRLAAEAERADLEAAA